MIGGSIDMLATGAVLSNFPARGQGKAFLINNVEFATAQLWVREDQGVKTWADLKGKKIPRPPARRRMSSSTMRCARTASIPSKDVGDREPAHGGSRDLVHLRRRSGSGPVGARSTSPCRDKVPTAKKLVDASALLSAGRHRRRLGDAPGLSTTRTAT
jgi:NitT/TauT family transport system substrate-binding protein